MGNHSVHLRWNNSSLAYHIAAVQGIQSNFTLSLFTPTAMMNTYAALISTFNGFSTFNFWYVVANNKSHVKWC